MIVADSAPIIYLAKAGKLHLLKKLYETVLVTDGVVGEVLVEGKPGTAEVREALAEDWLEEVESEPDFDYGNESISETDAEVITLARRREIPLLTNDKALYYSAKSLGAKPKWFTKGVLVYAVKSEHLTSDEAEKLLIDLVQVGLRVRSEVFAKLIGEIRSFES